MNEYEVTVTCKQNEERVLHIYTAAKHERGTKPFNCRCHLWAKTYNLSNCVDERQKMCDYSSLSGLTPSALVILLVDIGLTQ